MKNLTLLCLIATLFLLNSWRDKQPTDFKSDKSASVEVDSTFKEHPTIFTLRAQGNTMSEMKFDLDTITINAGKEITITMINESEDEYMMHNLVIVLYGFVEEVAIRGIMKKDSGYVDLEDSAVIAASPLSSPGETVSLSFKIDQKGTYQYTCTYPGRWSKMLGTLIVE